MTRDRFKKDEQGMTLAHREAIAMGRRIAHAREEKRWTQEELGEAAGGYSRAAVNRLEHGDRLNPSAALIYGVARALGMSFEELWTGVRARPAAGVVAVREALRQIERHLPPDLPEPSADPTRSPGAGGERGGPRSAR